MMSKIKSLIKLLTFSLLNLIIFPQKKVVPNSLLLVRMDAIGDYVLFRNFIEELKKSEKYNNCQITLLGNNAWKDLAEELDGKFVDRFIWLDRKKFNRNLLYRYRKLKLITSQGYETVINPVYSREFYFGDNINKLIVANEKIASIGDFSNIKPWQKKISNHYYTQLIPAKREIIFEFYRNKEFFENLLEQKINIKKPFINLGRNHISRQLPQKYAILFIGASSQFRKWPLVNFAKVACYLKEKHEFEIIVCGGPGDCEDVHEFATQYGNDFIDLVGKTSLIDLLYVIYNGDLLISNETSAAHLAVAIERTNVLVISNGNHFGRFTPYPPEITDRYQVVYHPDIEKNLDQYKLLSNSYGYGSRLDIGQVCASEVIKRIDTMLEKAT